ncbi:MAG: DUF2460 domain-containing protein [Selenomonas sp.]|uniref:hypothetical protein n=1 Tax=Selenomonas sp. TaxID=2053611 RepID=UPI0025F90349|nr:hypothetical protein [Selenomonas sp.]MCI6233228.1 DUF2460 domain-containing protein [Selenomonas sp.]
MATKQALMTTTAANRVTTSDIPTLTGFEVKETCPDGTATRYVVKKSGGNWQKYDAGAKAWADVATQSLTAASVMTEGNTAAELNAVPKDGMTPFTGKTIDVAAAMESDDDGNLPTIDHVTVKGESGTFSLTETKDYPAITLNSNQAVDILDILVTKKETGSGTVTVYASIQNDNGDWGEYQEYTTYLGENATKAKAIKFRATFNVVNVGTDFATLTSIEVRSRTDNVAVFTEGTSACITKTYDFGNVMARAHLVVKHHTVPDTKITAQIALRNPPKTVKDEMLGTGDGVQHTVKLANLAKLASHGFHLYFDGTEQERDTYSYSPTDGQVTYTAGAGQTVTVDYIYDWEPEKWVDMTYDNSYPDRKDDTLISEQFDYEAKGDSPTGSVGTVRVTMIQLEGKETDVTLGTGTGKAVSYKLAHHARVGKIQVSPADAKWRYKENTDYLTVTAAEGAEVKVTYEWVARPLALDTLICVFDE